MKQIKTNYITNLYFLVVNHKDQDTKKVIFIYGNSLPTEQEVYDEAIMRSIPLNKKQLIIRFTIIKNRILLNEKNEFDFEGFINQEEYQISLAGFKSSIVSSFDINRNIPNSMLPIPLKMNVYKTQDIFEYLKTIDISMSIDIIESLESFSNLNFKTNYINRLGTYEVGDFPELNCFIENTTTGPYLLDLNRNIGLDDEYYFLKNYDMENEYVIHLIVFDIDNEVIYDKITFINSLDTKIILCNIDNEINSSYEYWVFDNNQNLLERNKFTFIRSIGLNMNVTSNSYQISKESFDKKSLLKKEGLNVVTSRNVSNSTISVYDTFPNINNELINNIKEQMKSDNIFLDGKWFNKNTNNEYKELISFFNKITQSSTFEIYFIDPFISSSSSIEYLLGISNLDVKITFISCWKDDQSADGTIGTNKADEQDALVNTLNSLQEINIPLSHTTWYDLKADLFHDRFIYLLNKKENTETVFSISNSLNNLLKNYENLTILPINGKPKFEAIKYLKKLTSLCNDDNRIYPINNKEEITNG